MRRSRPARRGPLHRQLHRFGRRVGGGNESHPRRTHATANVFYLKRRATCWYRQRPRRSPRSCVTPTRTYSTRRHGPIRIIDALAQLAAHQRARTLLEGVLAWGTQQGGTTSDDVRELTITDAEIAELRAAWWWRPLGRIRPRYRWSTGAFLPEYSLFGTLLLVSEGIVDEPYARAFTGEHPWSDRVDAIRDITPSWLWRLYHDGK